MHFLFDAMENGTKFVMIDPRFTRSAAKADEWVAPRAGTDAALALGMINVVIKRGAAEGRLCPEAYQPALPCRSCHPDGASQTRCDRGGR